MVPKGNPKNLHALADLKGHTISLMTGTNYAEWIQAIPGVNFQGYKDWAQIVPEPAIGRTDAALFDQPVVAAQMKEHPEWKIEIVEDYEPRTLKNPAGYSTYAFRQADIQWVTAFSSAVQRMQYNGEMKKILTKWGLTGYNNEERQLFSLDDMTQFLPSLLQGALLTITVSLIAFALAMVCGLATGLARMSRIWPLRVVAAIYIQFIRGTPLLLQLFFIYYVLPYAGIVLTPFVSGVLGLTVNYTAYMAEVFRSGIQAVPKGQWEAGASVGMSRRLMLRRIILPQAIRIIVPSIGNFFVSIFKDSALVSVITMRDLMFSGQLVASATYKHFEIFTMLAVIYFLIS